MHASHNSRGKVFDNTEVAVRARLAADTDTCVKCALCLPVCPTYALNRTETQSPRGRVSLAQAMARGQLEAAQARPAFDACLTCMACEQVCPARVPYAAIIDGARALSGGPSRPEALAAAALARPWLIRLLGAAHRLSMALPLPGALARWRALPGDARAGSVQFRPRAANAHKRPVTLLAGCLSPTFDAAALSDLAALFEYVGRPVQRVDGCCGALARHGGDSALADRLGARLTASLRETAGPVVHIASGCGAGAKQIPDAAGFADRVVDPFALLLKDGLAERLATRAGRPRRVLWHEPCTQRNTLRARGAVGKLLDAIPDVAVVPAIGHGCCGAAGSHMVTQPDAARSLADAVLGPVPDLADVDVLVSANIGCAWHLRGALHDRRSALPVMHPATFMARSLSDAPHGE